MGRGGHGTMTPHPSDQQNGLFVRTEVESSGTFQGKSCQSGAGLWASAPSASRPRSGPGPCAEDGEPAAPRAGLQGAAHACSSARCLALAQGFARLLPVARRPPLARPRPLSPRCTYSAGQVCTELENHVGVGDKTLAEFIINLAGQCSRLSGK